MGEPLPLQWAYCTLVYGQNGTKNVLWGYLQQIQRNNYSGLNLGQM